MVLKHTKGPWHIYWLEGILQDEPHAFLKSGDSKYPFIWIRGKCGDQNDKDSSLQFQRDVHLMAAAPDLLEACEEVAKCSARGNSQAYIRLEALDKLLAAVAIAKGENCD